MKSEAAARRRKSKSREFLYILRTQSGQCERAGVSADEFYIPAVLTVNKAVEQGAGCGGGGGLGGWGRVAAILEEKPRGMIKVVNICRCRGPALVQN